MKKIVHISILFLCLIAHAVPQNSIPSFQAETETPRRLVFHEKPSYARFYLSMLPDIEYTFVAAAEAGQTLEVTIDYWRGVRITITSGSSTWNYSGPGGEASSAMLSIVSVPVSGDYLITIQATGFPRSENPFYLCTIRRY